MITEETNIVTTNLVIAETYILIRRHLGHGPAIRFLDSLSASPRINKVYSSAELEESAEDILKKYQDQAFSYTDAVSFAVMSDEKIERAFTFDKHFKTAGFTTFP